MGSYVCFEDVGKIYTTGEVETQALHQVNLTIEKGELCVITGPSGAGKTTLLNILGGMDTLTTGHVFLDGQEVSAMSAKQLTLYRRREIGFVFQFYNLVPNLTAIENVKLASAICPHPLDAQRVMELVGLCATIRRSFPAENSSAWPLRVPSPKTPSCCFVTNRPARSITTRASRF